MAKPNAFVGASGDLLDLLKRHEWLEWFRETTRQNHTVIVVGCGTQINKVFTARGWPIRFGPLGRECETLEQKQACRDVAEEIQGDLQDFLARNGISAEVIKPFDDVGSVLCPVNLDVKILAAYNGFSVLYRLTLKERVEKKRTALFGAIRSLGLGQGDPAEKLKIIGF